MKSLELQFFTPLALLKQSTGLVHIGPVINIVVETQFPSRMF